MCVRIPTESFVIKGSIVACVLGGREGKWQRKVQNHTHTHLWFEANLLGLKEALYPEWARATRMCKTVTVHPVNQFDGCFPEMCSCCKKVWCFFV